MENSTSMNDTIVYEDIEPINFRKFKKTIPLDGKWEDRVFYEIKTNNKEWHNAIKWCNKHYGGQSYTDTWWSTNNAVIMNEKIYIHYKLME